MAKVSLKGISKIYDNGFQAVKSIDLEIKDKEFMVLVGPSGCGKTTSLRMIAGLEEISSGDLTIGDQYVNNVAPKDRNIAMVFQNYALYPHMTVYDNMAFGLKLQKTPKDEIKERIEKTARILDIEQLLTRKPKQLSGGQRQRVALGRAIVRKPEVFLMDEPLSNLDAKLRVQMRAELIKLHNDLQTTFVYVTHDQTEAMTMGTRICVMNDGIIQQVAEPKVIYNHPVNMFVASFIGAPQMNFLNGTIVEKNNKIFASIDGTEFELDEAIVKAVKNGGYVGKEVVVGVRPEDIKIVGEGQGLKVKVEVTELLGSDLNVYFSYKGRQYIAKEDAHVELEFNQELHVSFNSEKIHLFDKESEKSILASI
ncbi:sn-glycerol-3-phosphate ABC transporter ATP-binding protein UgpC [Fusibacter bizertensis]|uniref:Sn-glycerol-3-phosphate ABC transporter ATP-binding protein UgpC n=1 Tax=Fusibacter bizertensis TaxID=1488331 RepID=A0ABT6N8T7_9FIRM|nr:sn-glycerol-3-phosphate ABC transporter ATP-binding protein UgpC [Fusibacter bizertensis]MDH8676824.1 sn-glycerol-3-phosphate ABC transporter ATP-binding protein UgpC [Fusibacter bizertensis]